MSCPNHPNRTGEHLCVECAHMFCAQCIESRGGRQLCRACAAKTAAPPQGAAPPQPGAAPPQGQAPPAAPPTPLATPLPQPPMQPRMEPTYAPARSARSGTSVLSMVCGILSLVFCALFGLGLVLGVVAVLFGGMSLRGGVAEPIRAASRPYAIAGIIMGALGILLGILVLAGLAAMFSGFQRLQRTLPAG